MFLKLRIIFTILAAIFAALVLPVGVFGGLIWAITTALVAAVFYMIMLIFKQEQEKREPIQSEPLPSSEALEEKPTSSKESEDKNQTEKS